MTPEEDRENERHSMMLGIHTVHFGFVLAWALAPISLVASSLALMSAGLLSIDAARFDQNGPLGRRAHRLGTIHFVVGGLLCAFASYLWFSESARLAEEARKARISARAQVEPRLKQSFKLS